MRYRSLPIKYKLMLVIMATSSIALLLAGAALMTYEWLNYQQQATNATRVHAQMIALNSRAVLTFNDPHAAEQTLSALSAEKPILAACLYNREGRVFATYKQPDVEHAFPEAPGKDGVYVSGERLVLFQPVELDGQRVGTLYLLRSLSGINSRLWFYAGIVVLVLLVSLLVALGLSSVFQKIISQPILDLVGTTGAVAETKDYSRRAVRQSEDELGLLIDGFNGMLAQIQTQDAALREREILLQTFVEHAPASVCMLDSQMRYVLASSRWRKDFNLGEQSVIGRSHYDLFPEIPDRWKEIHRRCLAGAIERCEEDPFPRANGSIDWLRWEVHPWRLDSGAVGGIIIFSELITERKKAEQALRLSEEEYRAIFEAAGVGKALLHSETGLFLRVNNKLCEMTGFSEEALLKKKLSDITLPDDQYLGREDFNRLLAAHESSISSERRVVRNDGGIIWIELTASIFRDVEGHALYAIANIHDITDRKRAQEELNELNAVLEQRVHERTQELRAEVAVRQRAEEESAMRAEALGRSNRDLEAFAYIASHDLQEPLRTVAGCTELLNQRYKGKLDTDADRLMAYTLDGVTRMKTLIDDLLAYSRINKQPKPELRIESESAFEMALANLRAASAECGAVITHTPLPSLLADSTQLTQLFQNLLGNAIKYRGLSTPRIHVSAGRQGAEWIFSVRDNGIGIDPKYHERIFVIFQRLHGRELPGTGVGLAICKKIVEQHAGRIWVESQIGKGSTFYFTVTDKEGANS